jgi:hypothetical protein
MPYELESRIPEHLQHWIRSGAPLRWVESHQGQWNHQAWVDLLTALHHSGYGAGPVEVVGRILEETRRRWDNLKRWQESGEALRWVEAQHGQWNHHDWLTLLHRLEATGYGPVEPASLGHSLERIRREWWNLQRWQQSGQPRHWVEAQGGQWNHHDWLALLDLLRRSEFWPMDPAEIGRVLEGIRERQANLRRWQESGEAGCWVESHQGQWNHDEWLLLMQGLQLSEYGPLDPDGVGQVVEEARRQYFNLQRWLESGQGRRWVEEHQGRSTGEELRTLLRTLQHSEFWPLDPVSLAAAVRQMELEWVNLQRWEESGEPRKWVEDRQGRWDRRERQILVEYLRQTTYWPVDIPSMDRLLDRIRLEWWNLRRWQQSGLARHWLETYQGGRARHDWLQLLETLRQSDFWPVEMDALRQVIESFRPSLIQAA